MQGAVGQGAEAEDAEVQEVHRADQGVQRDRHQGTVGHRAEVLAVPGTPQEVRDEGKRKKPRQLRTTQGTQLIGPAHLDLSTLVTHQGCECRQVRIANKVPDPKPKRREREEAEIAKRAAGEPEQRVRQRE